MKNSAETFDIYQKIVENSSTGILVLEFANQKIIYASRSVDTFFPESSVLPHSSLSGESRELRGHSFRSFLADIDAEAADTLLEKIKTGKPLAWSHYFPAYGREYRFSGKQTSFDGQEVFLIYITNTTESYKEKARIRNHYHSQITMMSGVSPYALGLYRMNLTKNEFNPQVLGRASGRLRNQIPKTVDEFFEYAYERCGTLRDEKRFSSLFSRDHLLMSFAEGFPNHSLQHLYYMDEDRPIWITTSVNMARNPDTGDVEAILYTVDNNREKIIEEMLTVLTENDYEHIALIDASTGLSATLSEMRRQLTRDPLKQGIRYDSTMETYFKSKQSIENRDALIASLKLTTILRELESLEQTETSPLAGASFYERTYSFVENGRRLYKRVAFCRVNKAEDLICHTIQDITAITEQEKEQQEKLTEALAKAKSALDEKNVLLSRISRDIRTPLNVITGLTNLARTELGDRESVVRYLREISLSSANVGSIIEEILALRQIEEQQVILQPEVLEVSELLSEVTKALAPALQEKNQKFSVEAYGFETEKVLADRSCVETVLQKLLENAILYSPEGGEIRLTVTGGRRDGQKIFLTFIVTDHGCGMSEEKLRKHFGPEAGTMDVFEKSDDRIGLGLAIVRSYVRTMEGELSASSREGYGSEITVTLPFEVPFLDITGPARLAEDAEDFDFSGKRILLVDDHKLSRKIGKKMLENVHAFTETAKDGAEAIRRFEETKGAFDLILMDIRMPVMNGLEACRAIRQLPLSSADTVPVIAMTADAFEDDIRNSLDAGMNAHLAKPIDPKNLYGTLKSFFL
ncbi:MAG: response regulator [Lachnospiraceae bacterium]